MKKRLLLTDPKLVSYDPATGLRVPPEGILADPRSTFWRRRIRDKSMIEAPPAAPASRAPESKPRHLMTEPPKEA